MAFWSVDRGTALIFIRRKQAEVDQLFRQVATEYPSSNTRTVHQERTAMEVKVEGTGSESNHKGNHLIHHC